MIELKNIYKFLIDDFLFKVCIKLEQGLVMSLFVTHFSGKIMVCHFVTGHKESQIEEFLEDLNPSLALLTDWIITSGNTSLSVDMLIAFLEKMNRDDVVEIIEKANGRLQCYQCLVGRK